MKVLYINPWEGTLVCSDFVQIFIEQKDEKSFLYGLLPGQNCKDKTLIKACSDYKNATILLRRIYQDDGIDLTNPAGMDLSIDEYDQMFGFVKFEGKDYVLKELMHQTGKTLGTGFVETAARAIDDNKNEFTVYWKIDKAKARGEIGDPILDADYDDVDRVEPFDKLADLALSLDSSPSMDSFIHR